jgi:hypothetical protein
MPLLGKIGRGQVEFALPPLPEGSLNATLVFFHGANENSGPIDLSFYPADLVVNTNDFDDATSPWLAFSPDKSASQSYAFDVTELVQQFAGANLGFQLKAPDEFAVASAGQAGQTDGFSDFRILLASPSNLPPVVRILSPTNNARFPVATNVTIGVKAADADGVVKSVELLAGVKSLGVVPLPFSPGLFRLTWTNVPAGGYDLTAVATDDQGASSTSPPVHITVGTTQTVLGSAPALAIVPVLADVTELPDGKFQLTISGPAGGGIAIETSSNFANWTPLTVVANPTGTVRYIDTATAGSSRRFYRVKLAK